MGGNDERNPFLSVEYEDDVDESLEDVYLLPIGQSTPRTQTELRIHRRWAERVLDRSRGPALHDYCPQMTFLQHPWVPSRLSSLVSTSLH